jgi:hypothetical protein
MAVETRTAEDVLGAILPVQIGGQARILPVLPIGECRAWRTGLASAVDKGIGRMSLGDLADGGEVLNAIGDQVLDLVIAYDASAALGGREYLEKHATDAELYAIFRRLLEVSFPFVRDLRGLIVELKLLGLGELLAASRATSTSESSTPESSEPSDSEAPLVSSGS